MLALLERKMEKIIIIIIIRIVIDKMEESIQAEEKLYTAVSILLEFVSTVRLSQISTKRLILGKIVLTQLQHFLEARCTVTINSYFK